MDTKIQTASGNMVNFVCSRAVPVTPHNTAVIEKGMLYVGTGGDVKVRLSGQTTFTTFKNVPDGSFLPILVIGVHTETTATDMLMCY